MARHVRTFQPPAHFHAVGMGHHQVGHHHVGHHLHGNVQTLFAVGSINHSEFLAERIVEQAENVGIVLNNEDYGPCIVFPGILELRTVLRGIFLGVWQLFLFARCEGVGTEHFGHVVEVLWNHGHNLHALLFPG